MVFNPFRVRKENLFTYLYHLHSFSLFTASMVFTINQNFCKIGYSSWVFSLEKYETCTFTPHWDGLEMTGTFNEHVQTELYRNTRSNTKPEHISNFSTVVSEHQP